jgi:hypothetical protein
MMGIASFFGVIYMIFLLGLIGLGVYTIILIIKALRIYIDKNS